jgi:hypothetical protein
MSPSPARAYEPPPEEWINNTSTPIAAFRRCHCHNWRLDECPNVGVALWVRAVTSEIDQCHS